MPVNQKRLARASFQLGSASDYTQLTRWQHASIVPSRKGEGFIPFSLLGQTRYAIATNQVSTSQTLPDIVMVAGGVGTTALVISIDGYTWENLTTVPWLQCTAVAYGGGSWIAAGSSVNNLEFAVSTDGRNWTRYVSPLAEICAGLAYGIDGFGHGLWIAAGRNGGIVYSTDSLTWDRTTQTALSYIYTLTYGNGVWVAGGQARNYNVISTTDGIHWINRANIGSNGDPIYGITMLPNTTYLASNPANTDTLFSSPDARLWSNSTIPIITFSDLMGSSAPITIFANSAGVIIASASGYVGIARYIPSAGVWQASILHGNLQSLEKTIYYSSTFFAAGYGSGIAYSADNGLNWYISPSGLTSAVVIASKV